ncbi:unnamed protein product, partial [Rangifer tarandus platyrhynchus]
VRSRLWCSVHYESPQVPSRWSQPEAFQKSSHATQANTMLLRRKGLPPPLLADLLSSQSALRTSVSSSRHRTPLLSYYELTHVNLHCFSFDLTYCQIKSQRREEMKRRDLKGCSSFGVLPGGEPSAASRPDRCGSETGAQGLLFIIFTVAKSLQSCPTLYDPIDGSPPGSPVPGILQARTLEWVAISSSNA